MLLTCLIFLASRVGNTSLILRMSVVETGDLEAWAYDLVELEPSFFLLLVEGFLFWKYLDIVFTSFMDLGGRGGGGETLSREMGADLGIFLLFFYALVRVILGENLDAIFSLRVLNLLSVRKESQLA